MPFFRSITFSNQRSTERACPCGIRSSNSHDLLTVPSPSRRLPKFACRRYCPAAPRLSAEGDLKARKRRGTAPGWDVLPQKTSGLSPPVVDEVHRLSNDKRMGQIIAKKFLEHDTLPPLQIGTQFPKVGRGETCAESHRGASPRGSATAPRLSPPLPLRSDTCMLINLQERGSQGKISQSCRICNQTSTGPLNTRCELGWAGLD